jgi:hypothetical protein
MEEPEEIEIALTVEVDLSEGWGGEVGRKRCD